MQGEAHIVAALNQCLKDQLTAINQFFLHARMARDWGFGAFNDYEYGRSIKAMKMADELIERVLFLEGLPNLQDLGKLLIGENVPEMLDGDLAMLGSVRDNLQNAIDQAERARDFVTRDLLEELLESTEAQIDWVETQLHLLGQVGVENYLQSQIGGAS